MARRVVSVPRQAAPRRSVALPAFLRGRARDDAGDATVGIVVNALLWAMAIGYTALFIWLSWLRYDRFLMHAEDMGNMTQAVWNIAHGYFSPLFQFNNQRMKFGAEATGINTRLGIHVEPVLFLVAIPYIIFSSPVTLLVIQTLVVASGVFPAAWLARRHLKLPLAQVAFPLAYLLAPPLEAANLYEFHAVTLSAALLLWALYFADGARYRLFALFGVLAVFTKEEIGVAVALMGLWIWWRHRDRMSRTVGLTTAILSIGWSLFCFLVVIRHFHGGHSSPFCGRLNPFVINGQNTDASAKITTCSGVAKLWLQHPDQVLSVVWITQKRGFLHRMFITTGYLSLLSPLMLIISVPWYAIILASNDVHMYSGLADYPSELVPILIGSAIFGVAWLAHRVGPRLRIPPAVITTVACVWLLVASVANTHVNGFTPLATNFNAPAETYHDQIGHKVLAMIPPGASVSAGDYLNPHLSDRHNIYLFPIDTNDAQYAVGDVSRDNFPDRAVDEINLIRYCMLQAVIPGCKAGWGVRYAADGYVLLERTSADPTLRTTLPPSFDSFVTDAAPASIPHPMVVNFGPSLQLLGYDVQRRDEVNLRQPDVLVTTYWRVTAPITSPITPTLYMTNSGGAIDVQNHDFPGTDVLPITQWPVNKVMTLQATPLTVFTNENGPVDIDLAVYRPETCAEQLAAALAANPKLKAADFGCDLLTDQAHRYRPAVRQTAGRVPMEVVAGGTILKLAQVSAHW